MTRADRLALGTALGVPWLFIWQGLDFTDQGYLLTGYRCFFRHPEVTEDSGHMWLTNLIGATWDLLFHRVGVVGMRGLWALCLSIGLWLAFTLSRALTNGRAAALAVLAVSIFLSDRRETWFSYNTASSLIFVGTTFCLVWGMSRQRRGMLVAAGVLMGLAPFARFPNVLELALVATLAFAAWLETERRKTLLRDLALLAGGCIAAVLVALLAIFLRGDAHLYLDGVRSLFAPSMQEAGYDSGTLLDNFLGDQLRAVAAGFVVCAAGWGLSRLLALLPRVGAWTMVLLVAALSAYGLSRGDELWRWFVTGTSYFLLAAIALGVLQVRSELRYAAFAALVIVAVAPLGSNNGIKNAHMGMWLGLPLALVVLSALDVQRLKGQGARLAVILGLALAGEGVHRAATYTYRDGLRSELTASVSSPQLLGQFTTQARAAKVAQVMRALQDRVKPGDYLLAYEGTPLLQYLTKTRPYLNRPWLMGWERGDVVASLAAAAPERTGCLPVAVRTTRSTRGADWPKHPKRLEERPAQRGARVAINQFLREHGYRRVWDNGFFEILQPPSKGPVQCR